MNTMTALAARLGRCFVAISMAAFGIQFFIYARAVKELAVAWLRWIPGQPWAYVVGSALIIAGAAMLFAIEARLTAVLLGATILLWAVLRHLPLLAADLHDGSEWTNAGKAFAMSGCVFLAAWSLAGASDQRPRRFAGVISLLERIIPLTRFFLGVPMIIFGIEHFIYKRFVETLVPVWIPWHAFWICFAAVALIAGGSGMVLKMQARLAAALSGVMIFLWVLMLHIPRAVAALHDGNEWTSVFQALAWSGAAFILCEFFRAKNPSAEPGGEPLAAAVRRS